ncbi:MAG: hypothetical protein ACRDDY_15095 [Clostridium sp.]|uniref:hypothetical protein n=1 Tax=Clostridium sp. TaxID=1506 RepID=UPI003EE5600F
MTIKILRQYLELCGRFNVEPTLSGANKFKKNLTVLDNLLELGLERLVLDIVG